MFFINDRITTETRYDTIRFFDFTDCLDVLDSFFLYSLNKLPEYGTITITNQENRPDLLSYDIYSDTQYWWILLAYNNILDINELKAGRIISYPSLSGLEYLYEQASLLKRTS